MAVSSSAAAVPRLYLGTMTFGWSQASSPVTEAVAVELSKRAILGSSVSYLDSARIYANGLTEPIVGSCLRSLISADGKQPAKITTKAHPSQPQGLSRTGLEAQLRASLDALGVEAVDEFYLHQPDTECNLAESLEVCHDFVKQGLIVRLGMSNYHASEVERAVELCAANGWTQPTVYQGLYNPLNRAVEDELLPLLRKHNIDFVAYNALAAGLLTGKHDAKGGDVKVGRFKDNPNYMPRFYTDSNFRAVEAIKAALPEGLSLIGAVYQWLRRHSALSASDGILLGASSMAQLESNLDACAAAETAPDLPDACLAAFDEAWRIVRDAEEGGAFPYWRSYSKDMPGREGLDPGASYNAAKK